MFNKVYSELQKLVDANPDLPVVSFAGYSRTVEYPSDMPAVGEYVTSKDGRYTLFKSNGNVKETLRKYLGEKEFSSVEFSNALNFCYEKIPWKKAIPRKKCGGYFGIK